MIRSIHDRSLLLLLLPMLLAGCASQGAAGLATVSAVAVGGALAPVGEVYHAVSGDRERTGARIAAVQARLDPVCEKKIATIEGRDPVADANALVGAGIVALLPSIPGGTIYMGLQGARYDAAKVAQTHEAAAGSALFRELEALMDPYSADFKTEEGEPRYSSPVFNRFITVEGAYKAAFNREVYRLATEARTSR